MMDFSVNLNNYLTSDAARQAENDGMRDGKFLTSCSCLVRSPITDTPLTLQLTTPSPCTHYSPVSSESSHFSEKASF
jgi:hypothetical protein